MISPSFIAFAAKTLEMYYDVMKISTFSRGLWLAVCKTCRFCSIIQRNLTFSLLTWLGSPIFLFYEGLPKNNESCRISREPWYVAYWNFTCLWYRSIYTFDTKMHAIAWRHTVWCHSDWRHILDSVCDDTPLFHSTVPVFRNVYWKLCK